MAQNTVISTHAPVSSGTGPSIDTGINSDKQRGQSYELDNRLTAPMSKAMLIPPVNSLLRVEHAVPGRSV